MIKILKKFVHNLLQKFGYTLTVNLKSDPIVGQDKTFIKIYEQAKEYTMTSMDRMYALYNAISYIAKNDIPGDFVECGVWKGGSSMLIALTLKELRITDRKIYLYDTFEGMSEPTELDYEASGKSSDSVDTWKKKQKKAHNDWCYASIQEVESNMALTQFPQSNIIFVKGKVEETIPAKIPSKIALLRLDTDWYESTKHELDHLYPLITPKGVLIIDDYGFWAGARKAVDEYFSVSPILLNRIDDTGRIGIKNES